MLTDFGQREVCLLSYIKTRERRRKERRERERERALMIVLTGPNVAITLAPDDIGRYLATQYTPHTSQGFITFRNLIFEIISTLSGEDKKIIRTKHVTLELSVLVRLLAAQFISLLIW